MKGDERRTPSLANKAVATEALWPMFLSSLTAEQREKVEALPAEDKPVVLHRWVLSTTGSSGGLGEFQESLERIAFPLRST